MFRHEFLEQTDTETTQVAGKRHYRLPDGSYAPSVTTILSAKENEHIVAWKARVGNAVAEQVSNDARREGTAHHDLVEKLLLNQSVNKSQYSLDTQTLYSSIRKVLLDHISVVYGVEFFTFSKTLRLAGRTDCCCQFDGVVSIVDHKRVNRQKSEADIYDYFLQSCAYGLMIEEVHKIKVPSMTIIITAKDAAKPQIFTKNRYDYEDALKERIKDYYANYN